jgi:peptide/nickel transport system ATP-binding protein
MSPTDFLIRATRLTKEYEQRRPLSRRKFHVRALDGVTLAICAGSTFALIGESGSGKSTLGLCLAGLEKPTSGEICFDQQDLLNLKGPDLARVRGQIQLIFQDTAAALNPRFSAEEIVIEPMRIRSRLTAEERRPWAEQLMEQVGLPREWLNRRPHQFSGGQRQRLAIARALCVQPRLLILDEALAGLDLPVQAQILKLLQTLQTTHGLTYLFISHDLSLMARIADEIAILHEGRIVEQGNPRDLFARPRHPVTRALQEAIPGRRWGLSVGSA